MHAPDAASASRPTPLLAPWLRLGTAGVCMQLELPMAALLIARLPDESMQMLAFGSLAYPLAVVTESPSYMLTSLGTVKGMHGGAFGRMLRFSVMVAMLLAGASSVVACTPLFDMLAADVMRVPVATVPEARLALQVLLPVVLMNAVRWFFQGVLVQYTHETWIGLGTLLRVGVCASAMAVGGYLVQTGRVHAPGAVVAAFAVLCGSFTHCLYGVIRATQVRRRHPATPEQDAQARLIRMDRPGALAEGILVATIALFAVISVGAMTASWTGAQVGASAMLIGAATEYLWLLLRMCTARTRAASLR